LVLTSSHTDQQVFKDILEIGLDGQGDPLKGAMYLRRLTDWATQAVSGKPRELQDSKYATADTSGGQGDYLGREPREQQDEL
jgi:hypothetical protein